MARGPGRRDERHELSGHEPCRGMFKTPIAPRLADLQGCFSTLSKLCEDCPHKLDFEIQGQNLLDHLVPEFIRYTGHSSSKVRFYCLKSLQSLSAIRVPAVNANIDAYLEACFSRASDPSSDIRRLVCSAFGLVLNNRADKLVPHMANVISFVEFCTKDEDETVALEACEFWLTFAEDPNLRDQLQPYLPRIAPLLLHGMVYSDMDLIILDADEDDEAVPDKAEDIKPKNYGGKTHGSHETNDPSSSTHATTGKSREAAEQGLDDDDEEEDDDDWYEGDEEGVAEWNIRKCSAAALDVMAVSFGNVMLEVLLPHLKERLFSPDWQVRESGILALGAIAEGELVSHHRVSFASDFRLYRRARTPLAPACSMAH
jgi:transportin-1